MVMVAVVVVVEPLVLLALAALVVLVAVFAGFAAVGFLVGMHSPERGVRVLRRTVWISRNTGWSRGLSSGDYARLTAEADAQVLVALLHLRDLAAGLPRRFSIVSEMRDVRSRDLAEVAQADDFIISDRFIGLLLAQVAENADLAAVFADLFDPDGAEIYLRPASDYVVPGREVDGHTLLVAGVRRGEVVIGVRIAVRTTPGQREGIFVNMRKSTRLTLTAEDRVIVLAEA